MRKMFFYILVLITITSCSKPPDDFHINFKFNYGIDSISTIDSSITRRYYDSTVKTEFSLSSIERKKIFNIVNRNFNDLPRKFINDTSNIVIHPTDSYYLRLVKNGIVKDFYVIEGFFYDEQSEMIYDICLSIDEIIRKNESYKKLKKTDLILM
jgi:hypothetical protein